MVSINDIVLTGQLNKDLIYSHTQVQQLNLVLLVVMLRSGMVTHRVLVLQLVRHQPSIQLLYLVAAMDT